MFSFDGMSAPSCAAYQQSASGRGARNAPRSSAHGQAAIPRALLAHDAKEEVDTIRLVSPIPAMENVGPLVKEVDDCVSRQRQVRHSRERD